MSDNIAQAAAPFPFMKLPIEIRFMVYREHFLQPEEEFVFEYTPWSTGIKRWVNHDVPVQRVFETSKVVYQEAAPLYFRTKPFHFNSIITLATFLERCGPTCLHNLSTITFAHQGAYAAKAFKLLAKCLSLDSVTIIAVVYTPKYDTATGTRLLMKSAGIKDLLKVRGVKNVQVEFRGYVAPDGDQFVEALQVLKEPHDPAKLKRLLAQLTPKEKAQRSVFGKANVITRAERRVVGEPDA